MGAIIAAVAVAAMGITVPTMVVAARSQTTAAMAAAGTITADAPRAAGMAAVTVAAGTVTAAADMALQVAREWRRRQLQGVVKLRLLPRLSRELELVG